MSILWSILCFKSSLRYGGIYGFAVRNVAGEHRSQCSPAYLYSNGGPGVPYALPNGIALYCTTDGNSYLVPAAQQQVPVTYDLLVKPSVYILIFRMSKLFENVMLSDAYIFFLVQMEVEK